MAQRCAVRAMHIATTGEAALGGQTVVAEGESQATSRSCR